MASGDANRAAELTLDPNLHIRVDGTVHLSSSDFDTFTACGLDSRLVKDDYASIITLDPVDCILCLTEPHHEPYFRCACSWVGGDPDIYRGRQTCPACWHHDKKRVDVTAIVS